MPRPRIAPESYLLAALCLIDLLLTVYLVQAGVAVEANPILNIYLQAGLWPFIGAKLLLTLGPLTALELLRSRRPGFVQRALRLAIERIKMPGS